MRWAQHWLELLDDTDPSAARRIVRGRAYARAGRVTDVRVAPGCLSGRVHGSKATPWVVDLAVAVLSDHQWQAVVGVLAGQVRHSAQLLAGQVSEALAGELAAAGIQLLPAATDVTPVCPCGDDAAVCAHVAAVWEAAANRFATDPLLLLRLRGRGRERLLADLAQARRRTVPDAPGVPLERLDVQRWGRLRAPLHGSAHGQREGEPATPAAPLGALGDPPVWAGGVSAWDLLHPLVVRGAAWARDLERWALPADPAASDDY